MSVSYEYYKVFYYVGKYGSFTQAAKLLMNNQPNVTRMMNNLESELGCRLLLRSQKGVTLTPEGEKLFARVESAFAQIQLGEAEIVAKNSLQSGTLSIAISEIALHVCMLPILQKYKATYPGISVRILNTTTPQGIRAVEQGTAELAVVSSPVSFSGSLTSKKISSFREKLIAGSYYAPRFQGSVSLSDLSEAPLITLGKDTTSRLYLDTLFAENGLLLVPSVEAATTDQILPMVSHDVGIGFVPEEFARHALKANEVFEIKLKADIPARDVCLIKDKKRPLSLASKALENMITNSAQG